MLWKHVAIWCEEDEASYDLTREDFIVKLLFEKGHVSCSVRQILAFEVCNELNLAPTAYYKHLERIAGLIQQKGDGIQFPDYHTIRKSTGCTLNISRQLWHAIPLLRSRLPAPSPESSTASSSESSVGSALNEMD